MQKFEIPVKFITLNEYINKCKQSRGNYSPAQMYKGKMDAVIAFYCKQGKVRPINKPFKMHCIWYEETARRDPDNVAFAKKFILDGMQKAKILKNDNSRLVKGFMDSFVYGEGQKVVVEIYEEDEL